MFTKYRLSAFVLLLACAASFAVAETHQVTGLLLAADPSHHSITVSCKEIPGYMDAMVMSFPVRDAKMADSLGPGMMVEFSLIVDGDASYAENLRIKPFESLELDPAEARRFKLIESSIPVHSQANVLRIGQAVPDFQLNDQNHEKVSLSALAGKVVAITFIYTRCPLPNYCVRLSNNFGLLQRRFKNRMGQDLILLTIMIDPAHDQPESLNSYARTWKADAHTWHFLTGPIEVIQNVCKGFDMAFYPEEALYVHSFHTVVVDRGGHLAANLEGNDFTAQQLGDLVQTVMDRGK